MSLRFKQCEVKDIPRLSQIARETFINAFEHMNNPVDFKHYLDEAFSEEQLLKELKKEGSRFFFAYLDLEIVGYFKLNSGEAQTEETGENAIELERIYVIEDFQNKGLGQAILNYTVDLARREQFDFIWLGVWQKNTNAIGFYQKCGFEIFDSHPYYIGNDKQTDWLMKLDLNQDLGRP